MVNSEEFSQRLQRILEHYDISAAAFSDAIDVGRSSISHILSGRNKPSLDFVLKIVQTYPEVELYWLLNGKGEFPKKSGAEKKVENSRPASPIAPPAEESSISAQEVHQSLSTVKPTGGKIIKKILVLYTDGSFDAYEN